MTIGGIIEALGLGAAREAKLLVGRLTGEGMAVATLDDAIARALERAGHRVVTEGAQMGLSLPLPEDGAAAVERLTQLARAVHPGGEVILLGGSDRARDGGLMLRAGLSSLRQFSEGGIVLTSGRSPRQEHT